MHNAGGLYQINAVADSNVVQPALKTTLTGPSREVRHRKNAPVEGAKPYNTTYEVGYSIASQFSYKLKRYFGQSIAEMLHEFSAA